MTAQPRLPPVGLLGGTFDPVHFGHLRLAEEARDHLGLMQVRWVPAGAPPHRSTPLASARERLEMVRLAVAGNPAFLVDEAEADSQGLSYTVDTLVRQRKALGPTRPLVLVLGLDAFRGLHSWHRWHDLLQLAHIALAGRPGYPLDTESLAPELASEFAARKLVDASALAGSPAGAIVQFDMTPLAISATDIRRRLAHGMSARYLLPDQVLDYIARNRLYSSTPETHGRQNAAANRGQRP